VSPRFLTAFSLNNVGQYPEVNALGTLALLLLTPGTGLLLVGFVLGLALWQQLLALYFILTAALAALVTPALRSCAGRACCSTASSGSSPARTRSSSGTRPTPGRPSTGWGRGEKSPWIG
jgi:hypothetical protein